MAIWHFRFSLVPVSGVVRLHNQVPPSIEALKGHHTVILSEDDWPQYWQGIGTRAIQDAFRSCLPRVETWGEATAFGDAQGSEIRIEDDDVDVKLDVRHVDDYLIKAILDIAREMRNESFDCIN